MSSSVVVGGELASAMPGEAKPLPTLRQSVSAVVRSSEAGKPCRPPGETRNAMTLLPGEGRTEQGRGWQNSHPKPSVPPALMVGGAADTSPLTGELENAITKAAAVITRVGDAANGSSTALLQYQGGSSKEAPALCASSRDALDIPHDHGGESCAERKGDDEGGGSALPPISNLNCRVAVPVGVAHGSINSQSLEAVCCTDEREGRPAVEPNLAATRPANQCTANEGQQVGAAEGTSACTGEDDLEVSDSRDEETSPSTTRPRHVMEDVPGSSEVLATGACVDGEIEPATAKKITASARPAVAEVDMDGVGTRLETSHEAEGESDSIVGGDVSDTKIVQAKHDDASDREGNEGGSVKMPPSPEQSLPPVVEADGVDGSTKADRNQDGVFLPSESFDGAKHGYVFRLGDKGLGFYVDGYVDRPTKAKHAPLHRAWNAGPGNDVIRRAPIGPVHKPFKKIKTRPREGESAAEERNMGPFTARLAARRNARAFQSTLGEREHAVDAHTLALLDNLYDPALFKGQTKLDFLKAEHRYPGTYGTDGRVILEEGVPVSNELHRTDEQKERARTYGFKAMQRFQVAHGDLVAAISKKEEDLQNALRSTDPTILQDMEEQAVNSSGGVGVYRQKRGVGRESGLRGRSSTVVRPMKSPEKLRDSFAQSLEVQIRGKDKALMKKVAGLDEEKTKQVVDSLAKGGECLPDSWRQNPDSFKRIQKHWKQLVAEIEADRRKVVCPWRPGGRHIAREPWQVFVPRDHRPPIRSASEEKAGTLVGENEGVTVQECERRRRTRRSGGRGSGGGEAERPRTAPSRRRQPFIDIIGPHARRMLAAQSPGTPLHSAFSTYSNDPFPRFEPTRRPTRQSGQAPRSPGPYLEGSNVSGGTRHGRQQRVWSAMVGPSSTRDRTLSSNNAKRPHPAAPRAQSQFRSPPQRPSTASGATNASESMDRLDGRPSADIAPEREQGCTTSSQSLDLSVRSGPEVTVLWARLCKPSSDLAYKGSTWPSRPRKSGPNHLSRRRDKPSRKVVTETVGAAHENPAKRDDVGVATSAGCTCSTPVVDAECKHGGDISRLSGRREGGGETPLVDLEDALLASTWKRINERHIVFRGYAERSRRARAWDPESAVYAKGASTDHAASPESCNVEWNGGRERSGTFMMACPGARDDARDHRSEKRNRHKCVAADGGHPVEMDWKEVDIRHFREEADKIDASLEGKLCATDTDSCTREHLEDCFREAHSFVASAGALLGCPKDERERFSKQRGEDLNIVHYTATVSRLSILWAAICGVVEIVGMLQRRKELLEVFSSERHRSATQNKGAATILDNDDDQTAGQEILLATSSSRIEVLPVELIRTCQYWKRLELADNAIAVVESLKLWQGIVPWRVDVLYDGQQLVSSIATEEETLPWPPKPESSTGTDDVRVDGEGGRGPDGGRIPGQEA